MQPGDVSHALIQQGERERLRKTPSSSSTTAWWWWRSVAILQGFAKHRGRGGRRDAGLRHGEIGTLVLAAPKPSSIYRGEGRGCAPFRVSTPRGAAAPNPSRIAAKGVERGNLPPKLGGAPPAQTLGALGPCGGAHQPTWGWSPPTCGPCRPPGTVVPLGGPPGPSWWSRYVTDKTRNPFGDQNRTSHI